jgi:Fic family protein
MPFRAEVAHNDLPLIPPHLVVETIEVLRATTAARVALMELDTRSRYIPNPAVLINAIPVVEAQASSAIENIFTTTDEMFQSDIQGMVGADPATREALRYRTALKVGFDSIGQRPLTTGTATSICSAILGHDTAIRTDAGTFIGNPLTQSVTYTPPTGRDNLLRLMSNWEDYIHRRDEVDPLVRLAVAHYQFEAIHPFPDGNGRTGRILNLLLLAEWGLLELPVLYLSRYFIATKAEYYERLMGVTARDEWHEWILYFVRGVETTALSATATVNRILRAHLDVRDRIVDEFGAANSALIEVLFTQPYSRIRDVVTRCQVSRPTATKWLDRLEAMGVLDSQRVGRDRLFVNRAFVAALYGDG